MDFELMGHHGAKSGISHAKTLSLSVERMNRKVTYLQTTFY